MIYFRKDHDRVREKDDERKKDDRRGEVDRSLRDQLLKERSGGLERNGNRNMKDDAGNRRDEPSRDLLPIRDANRKRDSQMLPGIVEKTAQDRDFVPKGIHYFYFCK